MTAPVQGPVQDVSPPMAPSRNAPARPSGPPSAGRTGGTTRIRIVAADAWRTFIVEPVRSNVIRSRGGGTTTVIWIVLGVAAFAVAAAGVVLGPALAESATAAGGTALPSSEPGSPLVVPSAFVPAFFILLFVGASLALFGAVLARPPVAAAAMVFVLIAVATPAVLGVRSGAPVTWSGPIVLLVAVAAIPVLRWRRPPLPVLQVLALLAGAGAVLPPYLYLASVARSGFGDFASDQLPALADTVTNQLDILVSPIIFLGGAAAVGFAITMTAFLRRGGALLSRSNPVVLAAIVGVLCIVGVVFAVLGQVDAIRSTGVWPAVGAAAVTAGAVALAVPWWRWAASGSRHPESGAARAQMPIVLVLTGPFLIAAVLSTVILLLADLGHLQGAAGWLSSVADWIGRPAVSNTWRLVLAAALIGWAVLRRAGAGPGPVAGWVGIVGAYDLIGWAWSRVAPHGPALDANPLAAVTVGALIAAAVSQAIHRRRPTPDQLATTGAVVALLALMQHRTFVSDPFGAVLGFAGVGFVFFGVVWGFLTSGGHATARGLAGLGRSTILLAYAIVPTALLAWKQASHGGQLTAATRSPIADYGAAYLGNPLLFALVAAWLPAALGLVGRRQLGLVGRRQLGPRREVTGSGQDGSHAGGDVAGGVRGPGGGGA